MNDTTDRVLALSREVGNRAVWSLERGDTITAGAARRALGLTAEQLAWFQNPIHAGGGRAPWQAVWDAILDVVLHPNKKAVKALLGIEGDDIAQRLFDSA